MESFKKTLKKLFCPPPLLTVLVAVPAFALVIFTLSKGLSGVLAQLSYLASAYALVITVTGLPGIVAKIQYAVKGNPITKKLLRTDFGDRFFKDVRFRTEISLYQGLFINILYIAMKLFSGIRYRAYWFVALALYYALLALMRMMLLRRGKKRASRTPMEEEWRRYRACGIVLLLMNQALMGIVVYMVKQNRGFEYPGYLIYAMALYAFYAIITAAVNLSKYRKHGSPVLSAAKAISFVAAMVSILALETAMLNQFNDDEFFRAAMTAGTGGSVCTIVIGMAVFMIVKSTRNLKQLKRSQ